MFGGLERGVGRVSGQSEVLLTISLVTGFKMAISKFCCEIWKCLMLWLMWLGFAMFLFHVGCLFTSIYSSLKSILFHTKAWWWLSLWMFPGYGVMWKSYNNLSFMYFAISHHGLVVTPSPSQEPKNFPVGDKFSQYVVVLVVHTQIQM